MIVVLINGLILFAAFSRGDPHITLLDGGPYGDKTWNGLGEYIILT